MGTCSYGCVFLLWAGFAKLDKVTTGTGKVIPSSQVQVIQSLDGGIMQELYVQEGEMVTKGQPLVRIDDTRFRSDYAQQEQEVFGLKPMLFVCAPNSTAF